MRIRTFVSGALALSLIGSPTLAEVPSKDAALLQGPAIHTFRSPFEPAQECLRGQLTPEQKLVRFSVGMFSDESNKFNAVADAGTGAFSSQGAQEMLATSLFKTGVATTDFSPTWRAGTDWVLGKLAMSTRGPNDPRLNISLAYPDVIITGGITSFDFMPGGGAYVSAFGFGIGHKQSRILVGMDARAVLMVNAKLPGAGGDILAVDRSDKQIVGYETSAGGAGFFGPRGTSTYVTVDFGRRKTEAIQRVERVMLDRLAARLVADTFNIKACDAFIDFGDNLARVENRTD